MGPLRQGQVSTNMRSTLPTSATKRWKFLRQRRRSSNLPGPSPLFTQGDDDMKKWIGIFLVIAAVAVGVFYGLVYAALRALVAGSIQTGST